MVALAISLDDQLVGGQLSRLLAASSDLTPLMQDIGNLLEASAKMRIRDINTAPDGTAWAPSQRASEDGGKTLYQSGALEVSITNEAGPDQVEIGTNLVYASIHQTGGTIVPKNGEALMFALPGGGFATVASVTIPARPYLGVSDADEENIQDATMHHFEMTGDLA